MKIPNRMKRAAQPRQTDPPNEEKLFTFAPSEIMGRLHPGMNPDLAKKILPGGVPLSIDLLSRVGLLCDPLAYRAIPNGELMSIADQLNSALDKALREQQEKNVKEIGRARPFEAVKEPSKGDSTGV